MYIGGQVLKTLIPVMAPANSRAHLIGEIYRETGFHFETIAHEHTISSIHRCWLLLVGNFSIPQEKLKHINDTISGPE